MSPRPSRILSDSSSDLHRATPKERRGKLRRPYEPNRRTIHRSVARLTLEIHHGKVRCSGNTGVKVAPPHEEESREIFCAAFCADDGILR